MGCVIVERDCLQFLADLPAGSVDLIVTDPAYSGLNQHLQIGSSRMLGEYGKEGGRPGKWFQEFHDDPESWRVFLQECYRVLKPDRHLYLVFDSFSLITLAPVVREVFAVKGILVWDKVDIGMGHYYRRQHELILFAAKGDKKLPVKDAADVWRIRRLHDAAYPTQKPVELFYRMLYYSAEPGSVVLDPFSGSGASGVAALRRGCSYLGCDINPAAVRLARHRCQVYHDTRFDPGE